MSTTGSSRRYDLDWLRVLALATLIFYHVGMFYVTWDWHIKSDYASGALEVPMALVNPWRLSLLFFISGVALRFLLDSRGSRAVADDRINRLLLPLGFGMLVVVMPQAYFEFRAQNEIEPGILSFYPQYLWPWTQFSSITPTWNHLWFLPYILLYSLLLAAGCGLLTRLRTRFGPPAVAALRRAPWLALAVPATLVVIYTVFLDPLFPHTRMMINDWAAHAHSLTMVLLGWFVAKSPAFWNAIRSCTWPAVVLVLSLGAVLAMARVGVIAPPEELRLVVRGIYTWAVIALILALGQRFLNRPSRVLSYATAAILPWYILHQTLTVAIGYAFIGSGAPLWVEGPVVLFGTVLGCVVLYEVLIRRVGVMRTLFGLKPLEPAVKAEPGAEPKPAPPTR